jgi:hypothetical protein
MRFQYCYLPFSASVAKHFNKAVLIARYFIRVGNQSSGCGTEMPFCTLFALLLFTDCRLASVSHEPDILIMKINALDYAVPTEGLQLDRRTVFNWPVGQGG